VSTRSREIAVPVHRSLRASTIITIGRAAQGAAGGALPVSAQAGAHVSVHVGAHVGVHAGAPNINPTMTERTRDMPVKDST